MVPFHERLARVALDVAASYGFALAGGYAVQAHGFLDRPSADVDLFAEASAQFDFSQAVDAVIAAYRRDGLEADAEVRSSTFARLSVSSGEEPPLYPGGNTTYRKLIIRSQQSRTAEATAFTSTVTVVSTATRAPIPTGRSYSAMASIWRVVTACTGWVTRAL